MNSRHITPWIVGVAGLLLLSASGCSTKWTQSGGDLTKQGPVQADRSEATGREAENTSSAVASNEGGFPDLSRRDVDSAEGGPLRGFESLAPGQSPTEERVQGYEPPAQAQSLTEARFSQGIRPAKEQEADRANRRTAELRREEAAAVAAGLKDVFFGYDSWAIQEEGRQALTHDAEWLKENPKTLLRIGGHCDERGTQAYNMVLGEKRAKAARNYLVELGVSPEQVAIVSYGKEQPFCFERDEACHRQNRRGHVLLRAK